jgi:hypothetical protein
LDTSSPGWPPSELGGIRRLRRSRLRGHVHSSLDVDQALGTPGRGVALSLALQHTLPGCVVRAVRKVFRARPVHPMRRYAHRSWPDSLRSVLRVCTADPLASHLSLATALSRFLVSTAHAARSVLDASGTSSRKYRRSDRYVLADVPASRPSRAPCGPLPNPTPHRAPPLGFGHPCDGLLPTVPRGRRRSLPQRSRDSPFEACPHPDGYRFPGPCPPAVPWWRSSARCGSASGLRAPDEVPRDPGSTRRCFLGIALQGLPLAALAHGFCFPGPSSSALCALPPCGLQHPALWSLA